MWGISCPDHSSINRLLFSGDHHFCPFRDSCLFFNCMSSIIVQLLLALESSTILSELQKVSPGGDKLTIRLRNSCANPTAHAQFCWTPFTPWHWGRPIRHAEPIPPVDLGKPPSETFYLPMHAVRKEHSTTTKVRVVFDASAKSSSGISLNDTLLVGPTIHPSLTDVLLRFRSHRIALTADVSKMYRAIELAPSDRDLHRFVWRKV